ncbi:flavin reductase family protein [Streptomyces fradiae]|uniref:flavin reductase family protein n=1 Tax=Streptomyces fradiae TaxID=1906 RepID=UPI00351683CB
MTTSAAALSPPAAGSAAKTPLRRVLGKFATGVAVIASQSDQGPVGVLVNSFTSVSLTPPTVLFCISTGSRTWPYIEKSGSFAASFLADGQRAAAERFWRSDHDRFAGSPVTTATTGAPVLSEALGYVDCRVSDILTRDDHYVVLGEVVDAGVLNAGRPLLFFEGAWNTSQDPAA